MTGLIRARTAGVLVSAAALLLGAGVDAASASRLDNASEILILNATTLSVDVYVNYEAQPTASDPKPLIGGFINGDDLSPTVFTVEGTLPRPYGVYTFSVRPKGQPAAELLASASVMLERGRGFAGVFHETPGGGYSFSIYEDDLTPAQSSRLTVRNTTTQHVTWRLVPNGEAPGIPTDERSGELAPGESQVARDVTDNDYVLEFFAGGQRVARHPDLDLAVGRNLVVYLIGQPQPTEDPQLLQKPVAYDEIQLDLAEAPEPDVVTPAAPPVSVADTNAPVEFSCPEVTIWETTMRSVTISAVDPDGFVNNLSIEWVDPPVGGVELRSQSLELSPAIGEPASARVRFTSGVPSGTYAIRVATNRGSSAQQAFCLLPLTVRPITFNRLVNQTEHFEGTGDIEAGVAANLRLIYVTGRRNLNDGFVAAACGNIKQALTQIGSEKGKKVSDLAADALAAQTKALGADLSCG